MFGNALRLLMICAVGACTVAQPARHEQAAGEAAGEAIDEIAAPIEEATNSPSTAMLAVARSGDPDAVAAAVAPRACRAPSTCPSQFSACGAWSTPTICEAVCTPRPCTNGEDGLIERDITNSFRMCFDPAGNVCTQWSANSVSSCGC